MELTDEVVDTTWKYVLGTCPELLARFDALDLRLSATRAAAAMGMRDGAFLERWLRGRSVPRFRVLRDWYYVTEMHRRAISKGGLSAVAKELGAYQSILSRFVTRVTGQAWRDFGKGSAMDVRRRCVEVWVADRPTLPYQ